MQQVVSIGYFFESSIGCGGGEEEGDSNCGGYHEHHERDHVLHYFDYNSEKHASALEEGEDVEGLHAVEEAQQSQKDCLSAILRRRAPLSNCHSEISECKGKAEDVEVVPEIMEVRAALFFISMDSMAKFQSRTGRRGMM